MKNTMKINHRFCGPPGVSNGGYVSGMLAQYIDGPTEVTLHRPVPLEQPLSVVKPTTGHIVALKYHDLTIAEAKPTKLALTIPDPPTFLEARDASLRYPQAKLHPFPSCFVCGPRRESNDGLHIFPTLLQNRNIVAATWTPDTSLINGNSMIKDEFIWAALDCPGGIVATTDQPRPILLGQLTGHIENRIHSGDRCIVIGWLISSMGRKHTTGTAIFRANGTLIASAKAIWIEPKQTYG